MRINISKDNYETIFVAASVSRFKSDFSKKYLNVFLDSLSDIYKEMKLHVLQPTSFSILVILGNR